MRNSFDINWHGIDWFEFSLSFLWSFLVEWDAVQVIKFTMALPREFLNSFNLVENMKSKWNENITHKKTVCLLFVVNFMWLIHAQCWTEYFHPINAVIMPAADATQNRIDDGDLHTPAKWLIEKSRFSCERGVCVRAWVRVGENEIAPFFLYFHHLFRQIYARIEWCDRTSDACIV